MMEIVDFLVTLILSLPRRQESIPLKTGQIPKNRLSHQPEALCLHN
jgi:hypothetical protein